MFAVLSILGFVVSLTIGVVVFCQNKKRLLNLLFGCACLSVALWSFTEFMFRQAESYDVAGFWIKCRAFVWPYSLAFIFHFMLVFTRKTKWLKAKAAPFLIYGPAVVFSAVDIGTFSITGRPLLRPWGYSFEIPETLINRLCDGWSVLLGLLSLFLAWRYYVQVSDRKKKRQAKSITVGIGGPILIGILSEIAMPVFGLRIPELTSAGMMWLAFFVGHAIWKYELFTLNPALVGENIIAMMNEMFFLLSPEGAIIRTNHKSQDILGYEEGEFAGRPLAAFMNDEAASRALMDRLRDEGAVENVEILLRTKSGGEIPAVFSGAAIRDRNTVIMGMVGISRDISDRKRIEEELRALSLLDELTGLYNRRGFLTLARHQLKVSARTGRDMVLLYADVDDFKKINDTYGHGAGDAALVRTAKIFKESFRSSDITARLGGDEFAVLALEASVPCSDMLKARLEGKLQAKLAEADFPFELSLSIGMICCDPQAPRSIEDLLIDADRAMYARKQARKAR